MVQYAHLAEIIIRAEDGQYDFMTVFACDQYLGAAAHNDIQRFGVVAGFDYEIASGGVLAK